MKRKLACRMLLVAGCVAAAPASAEILEVAPGRFTCDVPGSQYERVDVSHFAVQNSLTGRFRFLGGTYDRSAQPAAGFTFHFHDGQAIEVHVSAPRRFRRYLLVEVGASGVGSEQVARAPRNAQLEVRAGIAEGFLTVASGGASRQFRVGPRRVVRMEASCQSGRFEIDVAPAPRPAS